jgi:hypothetical protein
MPDSGEREQRSFIDFKTVGMSPHFMANDGNRLSRGDVVPWSTVRFVGTAIEVLLNDLLSLG